MTVHAAALSLRIPAIIAYGALIIGVLLAFPQQAQAKRGSIPVLLQVTSITTGDIQAPKLRSERAETIAFVSDGDVEGPGTAPGHREVYLYHSIYHPLAPNMIERVTNTVSGESYGVSRATDETFASGRPQYIAFVSTADLDPAVGNADGNPEIFLWELLTNTFHQLTNTLAPVVNADPYPSDSGKCIAFSSTGDLDDNDGSDNSNPGTGFSNPDGSQEVFIYSVATSDNFPRSGNYTQVSNGPAGTVSAKPAIGGYWFPRQCQSTVYTSDFDQLGNGALGTHIYVYKRPGGQVEQMTAREIPQGLQPGNYFSPNISSASNFARGPFVVFDTDSDLWLNQSTGRNTFRYRVFHPRMTQYTDQDIGETATPVISDGGAVIALESNGELLNQRRAAKYGGEPPFNPDGNSEIFRMKGRRKVVQITRSQNCSNTQPSIEDTGRSIAFRSTCDLIAGGNPSQLPQIFMYTLGNPDDLVSGSGCLVAEGCCNEANGCLDRIEGRLEKVSKKNCINKARGCN